MIVAEVMMVVVIVAVVVVLWYDDGDSGRWVVVLPCNWGLLLSKYYHSQLYGQLTAS